MKKYFKIFFILSFIFLAATCLYFNKKNKELMQQKSEIVKYYNKKEIKLTKTLEGKYKAEVEATELSVNTLKEMLKNSDEKAIQLKKENKKLNRIVSNVTFSSVTKDSIKGKLNDTIIIIDTITQIKGKNFKFHDDFLKEEIIIVGDSISVNYQDIDNYTVNIVQKRKWFLGKKRYNAIIYPQNPKSKPIMVQAIVVKKSNNIFKRLFK